jgi:hypothetical protein
LREFAEILTFYFIPNAKILIFFLYLAACNDERKTAQGIPLGGSYFSETLLGLVL